MAFLHWYIGGTSIIHHDRCRRAAYKHPKMAPSWLKKNALKTSDNQRTRAAELTLRQSIYPLMLVTILFFLWVSSSLVSISLACSLTNRHPPGLLLRPPRHSQQALPKHLGHHQSSLVRPSSRLLRRLPSRLARPRQLVASTLRLQNRLHLGSLPIRCGSSHSMALHPTPQLRRFLRCNLHHWKRSG